jgi:tRNA nucleotidyltransferase (CCA-adding enzyme)
MTWLESLETPIQEALAQFPEAVNVASITLEKRTFLVSLSSLQGMVQMNLGHLPISTVTLPYELSDILTRPHEEKLVRDYAHHLCDYFPNFFVAAIYEMQSLFAAKGLNAYIIGGITRDMLISAERRYDIQDVDITIEGKALEAAHYVDESSKNFSLKQEFAAFGTAKLGYKGQIEIDFASTRKEIYTACGALPEVQEVGVALEADIIRRDFTINALALSIVHPGQVTDCAGGLKDLKNQEIRLLKAESLFEDPSRILRAMLFAIRLGFKWGEDTHLLLGHFLQWMPEVYKGGGERIREELYKLLSTPESPQKIQWLTFFVDKGLHRLMDTHLPQTLELPLSLETISERLLCISERLATYWHKTYTWEVYLSFLFLGLPYDAIEPAMHRVGLTRHEIEVVEKSFRLLNENVIHILTREDNPAHLYDVFHSMPMGTACVGVLLSAQFETSLEALVKYKHELERVKLEVTGDDIMKLGVPQGEQVGKLLKALLHAKLQGQVHHRIEELNWLKAQISGSMEETPS